MTKRQRKGANKRRHWGKRHGPLTDEQREERASKWARRAAVLVLIAGAALVLVPALLHAGDVWQNPFTPEETVTKVTKTGPAPSQVVTTTTTAEADRSFVERSLTAGGLLLVRIGVVALAAFLAGAVVQRTLIGNFALKLGPLEIPELKRAAAETEQALAEVGKQLKKQAEATERAMQGAADAVGAVSQLDAEMEPVRVALQQIVELSTPTQPVEESEPTVDVQLENESEEPS